MFHPRTLIFHAGALGDFLSVLPALACHRWESAPGNVVLLGRRIHAELALAAGFVDECWDLDRSRFNCLFARNSATAVSLLGGFSSALLFTRPESPLEANLEAAGCQRIVRQDPFPPDRQSAYSYHLSWCANPRPLRDLLAPFQKMLLERGSGAGTSSMAVLHPGSGSLRKNWPMERFLRLASILAGEGLRVAWCLGPAEERIELPGLCLRNLSLLDLGTALARARLFVGNDSGVSHLAAVAGCPSLVLFGPSDERVWAPPGDNVAWLAPEGPPGDGRTMDRLPESRVIEAALKLVSGRS